MSPTFVLAVLIKGLLVLSIALGLTLLFRRASAAVRHGVWVAAFVALLALPVLEAMGPKWSVPVGPAPSAVEAVMAPLAPMPPTPPVPPAPPAPPPPPEASVLALERHAAQMERHAARLERRAEQMAARAEREMELELHRMERQIEHEAARAEAMAHRIAHVRSGTGNASFVLASSPASVIQTIQSVPREIVLAMLWFWGLGALAVGLAWTVAYAAARRAVRLGTLETDEDVLATWERIRILSGIARPVRLLRSPALDVPIAWGWGDAAVVLPASTDDWDDDRMEAVLLHELAHVIRGDAFSQLIAQIALVLHWANPLAWLAYRNFLQEREHACDDVVLEHGARPSAYADHLVQVARDLRRRSVALAAVAPMARCSKLEDRVRSILDPARKRAALSRAAGAALMLFLCGIALPLAALQPVTAEAQPAPAPDPPEVMVQVQVADDPQPVVALEDLDLDFDGDVLDGDMADVELAIADLDLDLDGLALTIEAPPTPRLALDTIPRFDDIIGPALERALQAVHAMRTSDAHRQFNLSSEDWDEMEAEIQEAIDDAREEYDEAIQEAIEEALEDIDDEDFSMSWSDQPDGARVGGYTSEEALKRARQDLRRARHDAERSLDHAEREIERQLRKLERENQRREQNQTRVHQRSVQRPVRVETPRREVRGPNSQGYATAYSVSGDRVRITASQGSGVEGWVAGIDGLDHGLDNLERAIADLERADSESHPGAHVGLGAGLSSIHSGLSGIWSAAQTWQGNDADRQTIEERVRGTRDRIRALRERLDDCED